VRREIGLAEKRLRETLEREDETIPDQRKKPTKRPTIRRVFQVFEGITVLYKGSEMVKVLNLRPIHAKILKLLGRSMRRCTAPLMDKGLRATEEHSNTNLKGCC